MEDKRKLKPEDLELLSYYRDANTPYKRIKRAIVRQWALTRNQGLVAIILDEITRITSGKDTIN